MPDAPSTGPASEWAEARTTIRNYDTMLQGLRQYGFTFIAGLLTAQGLIEVSLSSATTVVPAAVKAGVMLASMTLIGAIFVLDKMYRRIEGTAVIRARLLERRLGYELTEDASKVYSNQKISFSVDVLYSLLFVVAAILAYFTLQPDLIAWPSWYAVLTTSGAVIAIALVWMVGNRPDEWLVDWDAERYQVGRTVLRVTLTNFSELAVGANESEVMFQLRDQDGNLVCEGQSPKWTADEKAIPPSGQRTWEMSMKDVPAGSYLLEVRRWLRFRGRHGQDPSLRDMWNDRRMVRRTNELEPVPKPVTVSEGQ